VIFSTLVNLARSNSKSADLELGDLEIIISFIILFSIVFVFYVFIKNCPHSEIDDNSLVP